MRIDMFRDMQGNILDVGGGGEGIISALYRERVTAIDIRKDELHEVPYPSRKLVMDASSMEFEEESFDHVCAFYSMMFVSKKKHLKVLSEVFRVLKSGGSFYLWDVNIDRAYPEAFLVSLDVHTTVGNFTPTYGIIEEDAVQSANLFKEFCRSLGFRLVEESEQEEHFFQHWIKAPMNR